MKLRFLFPSLLSAGVLLAFSASGSPSAQTKAFLSTLEKASGEYTLVEGKGPMCSGGSLVRLEGGEPKYRLGARIFLSRFDAPEEIEEGYHDCKTHRLTKTGDEKLTVTERTVCPGKKDVLNTAHFEILGKRIRYYGSESNCLYEKVGA